MKLKSTLYTLLFLLLLCNGVLYSQEEEPSKIDSSMAFSPEFMPVFYDNIEAHFYKPFHFKSIDSIVSFTHLYDPLLETKNIYQTLGICGQAHQPMDYRFNTNESFSMVTLPYPLYFKQQKDLKFYDVKTSYTNIAYTYGILNENDFDAVHAQRYKDLTAIVNIHGYRNDGYLINQAIGNFNIDMLLHYEIPSQYYGFTFSYIFNRLKLEENGGITDMDNFINHRSKEVNGYPVHSTYGHSQINNHSILFQQYVNLKSKKGKYLGSITHSFEFKHLKTFYVDTHFDSLFYQPVIYLSADSTKDSLRCFNIINSIQWSNYSPFSQKADKNYLFRIAGGIMHEYTEAKFPHYIGNSITLFARTHIRLFKVMDIYARLAYTFMDYNGNDAVADIRTQWSINKQKEHFLGLSADFYRTSPDYILSHYEGNHNRWDTTWSKQNNLKLSVFWNYSGYRVSFNYIMVDNLVKLDDQFQPFCYTKPINVVQVNLFAPFSYKGFGLYANLYVQYSTKKYIAVPLFTGKASTFYTFKIFKKKMDIRIGIDMMYNTAYYADGYDPVLHYFYYQDTYKTGNYLYIDANLSIRVQRITFFARAGHFLSGIINYKYFTTPYYPMEGRRFEVGIAWRFFD